MFLSQVHTGTAPLFSYRSELLAIVDIRGMGGQRFQLAAQQDATGTGE